jgi:CubicO group peptidase (beta-lactamase class C family)
MTKPIFSVAALALIEAKALAFDDPVTKFLPGFRPALRGGRRPVITVRHLLTHTSGLTYKFLERVGGPYHEADVSDGLSEPGLSAQVNLRRLASVPLLFEPGTRWSYGLSLDVLGEVLARAGGAPLPELVERLVTQPLAMTDTAFVATDRHRLAWPYEGGKKAGPPVRMTEPYDTPPSKGIRFSPERAFDPKSYPSGGAGLVATARDYLRFLEALRTGGGGVLSPTMTRAMVDNQIGELPFGKGLRYGYGVRVLVDPAAKPSRRGRGSFAWGGVYGTGFWVDPEAKLAVVVLTNTTDNSLDSMLEAAIYAP